MNSLFYKKGFTLVEMLIVIAIIAILASVALVSVRGVRSSANDTKRISDLNKLQQQLEVYYTKNGNYPSVTYANLGTSLGASSMPTDPNPNAPYKYNVENNLQHYVLQAQLENANNILKDPNTIKAAGIAGKTWGGGDALSCDTTTNVYCVGN